MCCSSPNCVPHRALHLWIFLPIHTVPTNLPSTTIIFITVHHTHSLLLTEVASSLKKRVQYLYHNKPSAFLPALFLRLLPPRNLNLPSSVFILDHHLLYLFVPSLLFATRLPLVFACVRNATAAASAISLVSLRALQSRPLNIPSPLRPSPRNATHPFLFLSSLRPSASKHLIGFPAFLNTREFIVQTGVSLFAAGTTTVLVLESIAIAASLLRHYYSTCCADNLPCSAPPTTTNGIEGA